MKEETRTMSCASLDEEAEVREERRDEWAWLADALCGSRMKQGAALSFNFASALFTIMANKYAMEVFPYPAALTAIHYLFSWACVAALHAGGVFARGTVGAEHRRLFYTLIVAWACCNALSNASLSKNSVGFYQLMKVLTTPIVVVVDFVWHGKRTTLGKATLLAIACCGIGVATVQDVKLNLHGSLIAIASVLTGVVQKTLNEHMQQRCGLSSLQLMLAAFPSMTLIGTLIVPLMDPAGMLSISPDLAMVTRVVVSGVMAICINVSTTLVLGTTSALALVLLGQMKTCSVLLAGLFLFDAVPNRKSVAGATAAVLGIGFYTLIKALEKKKPAKPKDPDCSDSSDSATETLLERDAGAQPAEARFKIPNMEGVLGTDVAAPKLSPQRPLRAAPRRS